MKRIVVTNQELCVGCNRCTRACPIEMANLTYQDEDGNIKVKIDNEQCIACGECISVCKHEARFFTDDTEQFFTDLMNKVPMSIIAAPSIKTNIYDYKRLFTYFKNHGVDVIYDVSLGADICIWAHLRHIQKNLPISIITQPCAAIVSYCERHRHDLIDYLSPVHSPMACAAIYMRKYKGITTKIAALSPCIAKQNEFESIGVIDYNVTFVKLLEYLESHDIRLPEQESTFDHDDSGLGTLFPSPGGLKENLEFFLGKSLRIDRSEGQEVYKNLDIYADSDDFLLPDVFDVLSCSGGCNLGSGCLRQKNIFEIESTMNQERKTVTAIPRVKHDDRFDKKFDKVLTLTDFYRTYQPVETASFDVCEDDINNAFSLLGKDTYAKQNFNCGACGSESCKDMARKIALGVNLPVNCVIKSRDDALADHLENIKLMEQNSEYIELIRTIGHNLSSINDADYHHVVKNSMEVLCTTLHESSIHIWRRNDEDPENIRYKRVCEWVKETTHIVDVVYETQAPHLFSELASGNPVITTVSSMDDDERALFLPLNILSTCAVPIVIKEQFWGFASINNTREKGYTEQQLSLIASVSMLIASSIIERELTVSLIDAKEEALKSANAKGEFLSRMSHEMRTPMNAIIGMAKIAEGTTDIGRLRHCLSSIETSSTHLLGLINDVLDMSKIEAGKFELSMTSFNIRELVNRSCGLLTDEICKKNMTLELSFDEDMPLSYIGDEMRLSQVIVNIMSNAVKFTPEFGMISISVGHAYVCDESSLLKISISDTGIGMTPDQIERLFTSFEQADGSISRRFGGTGLGLVISKNIVEKMDGSIDVTSEIGKGSTFTISVNLKRTHTQEVTSDDAKQEKDIMQIKEIPDFSDVTLLLAEDVAINAEIFITLLSDTKISIDVAENGLIALEKFKTNPADYDIIIMDIQMPEMDGIEATRKIRALKNSYSDAIPIIAMTANAFQEDIDKCLECGMNDHLSKPIDVDLVFKKISQYIKR